MPDQSAEIPSPLENLQLHGFRFYDSPRGNYPYPYEDCRDRLPGLLRDYLTLTGQQETGKVIEGDEIILEEHTTEDQSFFGGSSEAEVTRKTYYRKTTNPLALVDGLKDRVEVLRGETSVFPSSITRYTYTLQEKPMGEDVSFLTAVDVNTIANNGEELLNSHVEYTPEESFIPLGAARENIRYGDISPVSHGLVPIEGGLHTNLQTLVLRAEELSKQRKDFRVVNEAGAKFVYLMLNARGEIPDAQFEYAWVYWYKIVDNQVVEWGYKPDMTTTQTQNPFKGEKKISRKYTYGNGYPTSMERYEGDTITTRIEYKYYDYIIKGEKSEDDKHLLVYDADDTVNKTHYEFNDLLTRYAVKEDDIRAYGRISITDEEKGGFLTRTIILPSFHNQRLVVNFPVLGEGDDKKLGDPTTFVVEDIPQEVED